MKFLLKVVLASVLCVFALTSGAATVALDSMSCSGGDAINGITVADVTGNNGGASDCFGTFDGNDPGPGDSFSLGTTIYDFVAKQDVGAGLTGDDIGLSITPSTASASGTWSFDSDLFAPIEFLVVLKAANTPGFAAWLFTGPDALSNAGDWAVAWTNANGDPRELSHLSIYATVVPVPAAAWLFGSGLLGLVGIARRKRA